MQSLAKQFGANNEIDDMLEELSRLNLELTCLLMFDAKLDSFSDEGRHPTSRPSRLLHAAEETNRTILPTDQGFQLWNWFETDDYKRIRESQEYLEKVAVELLAEKIKQISDHAQGQCVVGTSLIEQYLTNPKLDRKDLHGMAVDMHLFSTTFLGM